MPKICLGFMALSNRRIVGSVFQGGALAQIVADAATALQVWYDSADTSTYVPGATDEGTITQWKDKSSFARNANPTGGATTRPSYESTSLQNGNGYLEFDGGDSLSVNPYSQLQSASRFTAFVVAKSNNLPSDGTGTCLITTDQGDIRLVINNTSVAVGMNGANNFGTATVTDDDAGSNVGLWHQYTVLYNGSQSTDDAKLALRRDKADLTMTFTGSVPSTFSASNTTLYIGTRANDTGKLTGYIAEIILFNRVLTQSEYQGVENYLATKWGL